MVEELKKLLKHTTIYGMGNVLGKMVGFSMIPFYTHYLTTADYGTLELLDLSLSLTSLVLTMWMNASVIRHYYECDDERSRSEVIGTVGATAAFLGVAVAVLGIWFARPLSSLILKTPVFYTYIRLIALSFFFSCITAVNWSYLRAKQRSTFVVSMDLLKLVLTLGLNIYYIAYLKVGLIGVLYSSLITGALLAVILTANTLRHIRPHLSLEKLKTVLAFGAPLVITSVAAFAINFSDRFFLQHFSTVSEVGIYALGYKFGFMLSFLIVQPFDSIWSARMYEVAKQGDAGDAMSRIYTYYSLLLIGTALAMSLVIKEVIAVISPDSFHAAYKIVPIIALAYVFQGLNRYFISGMYIAKRTVSLGVISAITAIANLVLNYFLIGRYGMMGAAVSTAASFLFMTGLSYLVAQKVYPVPYSLFRMAAPLVLAAVVYLASTLVTGPLLLALAFKFAIFLLFPLGLYLIGFFDRREVEKARELARLFLVRSRLLAAAATGRS